jgi:hypothetical protein
MVSSRSSEDVNLIELAGGEHAIETMAIGIEWAVPMQPVDLARLSEVYRRNEEVSSFLPTAIASALNS